MENIIRTATIPLKEYEELRGFKKGYQALIENKPVVQVDGMEMIFIYAGDAAVEEINNIRKKSKERDEANKLAAEELFRLLNLPKNTHYTDYDKDIEELKKHVPTENSRVLTMLRSLWKRQ